MAEEEKKDERVRKRFEIKKPLPDDKIKQLKDTGRLIELTEKYFIMEFENELDMWGFLMASGLTPRAQTKIGG